MNSSSQKSEATQSVNRQGLSIVEVLVSIVVAMIGVFGVMILIPFAIKQAQSGLDRDAAVVVARNAYSLFEIGGYRIPTNWRIQRFDGNGNPLSIGADPALGLRSLQQRRTYSPFAPAQYVLEAFDDFNGDGVITSEPRGPHGNSQTIPDVLGWYQNVLNDGAGNPIGGDADVPAVLSIDPIGITANLFGTSAVDSNNAFNAAFFPFGYRNADGANPYPIGGIGPEPWVDLRIVPANLALFDGRMMDRAAANRMFRARDDFVFEEAAHELLGPEQVFDEVVEPGAVPLRARRQAEDGITWSVIVVPFKDDPSLQGTRRWAYKMYIIVYKDREPDMTMLAMAPKEQMACALVNVGSSGSSGLNSPVSRVELDAGVIAVSEFVARDDWVMLINQARRPRDPVDANGNAGIAETGFHRQIGFYRVVSSSDLIPGRSLASVTLDGPDCRFDDGSSALSRTYMVHLKNVIGVYERTFEPEFESSWTVTN